MRIKKLDAVKEIKIKLKVERICDEFCVIEISLKELKSCKPKVNRYLCNKENEWINREKTRQIFKFMESRANEDGIVKMNYNELIEEEVMLIMERYSSCVKNAIEEIYWYPKKAENLIKAFNCLNENAAKDLKEEIGDNVGKCNKYLESGEDVEATDWNDITDAELYPEYVYD